MAIISVSDGVQWGAARWVFEGVLTAVHHGLDEADSDLKIEIERALHDGTYYLALERVPHGKSMRFAQCLAVLYEELSSRQSDSAEDDSFGVYIGKVKELLDMCASGVSKDKGS